MASPLRLPNSRAFTEGLYVIGISGNDYLNALQRRKMYPPSVVSAHILPQIIAAIRNATEVLYANGARHFLLFNLPPVGCAPVLLATMRMPARDKYGCLQDVNSLSYDHNVQLLATVEGLRSTYPDAYFVLADYYGAFVHLLQNKAAYGITNTLDACCGGGVFFPYRFNLLLFCSNRSTVKLTTLCSDPNAFISWDGIHFTDRFNCYAFNLTIASGTFLNPSNAFTHCAQH
ncbi:hypothetical protein KP509_13G006400 [Ceratopteris richardii]|nr:hypothetical protein KP509_13G006400 [Ceratopteris richardii]